MLLVEGAGPRRLLAGVLPRRAPAGAAWARAAGLVIAGVEVRIQHSGYRADVAAASRHPMGP